MISLKEGGGRGITQAFPSGYDFCSTWGVCSHYGLSGDWYKLESKALKSLMGSWGKGMQDPVAKCQLSSPS